MWYNNNVLCGSDSVVECHLAKVKVASSNLVFRSKQRTLPKRIREAARMRLFYYHLLPEVFRMAKEYVLIADSTTDLPAELIRELGVEITSLSYTIGGETLPDTTEKECIENFYNRLRNGEMATTSQINSETFKEVFEKYIKEGKDVLYLGFSSGISGTYQSSCIARDDLREQYPDCRIETVDTLAACMGQGLLVYYAAKLKQEGKSIDEVISWVEENKLRLNHWFTVDDLGCLKRGGRISATSAMLGGLLNIKPVLDVDPDGKLRPITKVRGRKNALSGILGKMNELIENPDGQMIFISHGDCADDAAVLEKEIRSRYNVSDVITNYIGTTIGSHSGPGTLAVFFLGKTRV